MQTALPKLLAALLIPTSTQRRKEGDDLSKEAKLAKEDPTAPVWTPLLLPPTVLNYSGSLARKRTFEGSKD